VGNRKDSGFLGLGEKDWFRAFLLLAGVGLLWRLTRFAVGMPLWGDEAMLGLNIVERDFWGLLLPLDHHQVAPVPYLWLQKVAFLFWGANEYSMRVVALIEGIAALGVLGVVFQRSLPSPDWVVAFGIIAVGTYSVRHGVELKPYAQDLLMTGLVWLALTGYVRLPGWKTCGLLSMASVAAVFCSFPGVFIAGGAVGAAGVAAPRNRAGFSQVAVMAASVASAFLVVFLISTKGQLESHEVGMTKYWAESFPPREILALLFWLLQTHAGNLFAHPFGGKNFGSILTTFAFLVGLSVIIRQKTWWLVTAVLLPFLLTFLAAAMHRYPYGGSVRVSQHLVPAIAMMSGAGWCALIAAIPKENHRRFAAMALVGGLVLLGIGGSVHDIIKPSKAPGLLVARDVISDGMSALGPDDRIVSISPRSQFPAPILWMLIPVWERIEGPEWGGNPPTDPIGGRTWVLNLEPGKRLPDQVGEFWNGGKIVSHREWAIQLTPPEPKQFLQWILVEGAPPSE
jgi:hypothetical protein